MDLIVVCSLIFTAVFLFVLGVDTLRTSKGNIIASQSIKSQVKGRCR